MLDDCNGGNCTSELCSNGVLLEIPLRLCYHCLDGQVRSSAICIFIVVDLWTYYLHTTCLAPLAPSLCKNKTNNSQHSLLSFGISQRENTRLVQKDFVLEQLLLFVSGRKVLRETCALREWLGFCSKSRGIQQGLVLFFFS